MLTLFGGRTPSCAANVGARVEPAMCLLSPRRSRLPARHPGAGNAAAEAHSTVHLMRRIIAPGLSSSSSRAVRPDDPVRPHRRKSPALSAAVPRRTSRNDVERRPSDKTKTQRAQSRHRPQADRQTTSCSAAMNGRVFGPDRECLFRLMRDHLHEAEKLLDDLDGLHRLSPAERALAPRCWRVWRRLKRVRPWWRSWVV